MDFVTKELSGKGLPPSLARPSIDQNSNDANVAPIKYLPASLIPHRIHRNLLPPRLHWGFKLTLERLQEILLKNGYPMDTEYQRKSAVTTFSMKLGAAFYPVEIQFPPVMTGESGGMTSLVSFGNNYEIGKLMKSSEIQTMRERFGIEEDELKWWVDKNQWYWDTVESQYRRYQEATERLFSEPIYADSSESSASLSTNVSTETLIPLPTAVQ
ncbi:hypothetical protein C8J56DRAFT_1094836 [Mycena floridula]|nr:hypothetical protein C8J56DRAFT_1094836 [Mycena floridula]